MVRVRRLGISGFVGEMWNPASEARAGMGLAVLQGKGRLSISAFSLRSKAVEKFSFSSPGSLV